MKKRQQFHNGEKMISPNENNKRSHYIEEWKKVVSQI